MWRLVMMASIAIASCAGFGFVGVIAGGDFNRPTCAVMLVLGLAGAVALWRYFQRPIRPGENAA